MSLEVIPAAPEHEPILQNLLQLYAHDFSEFRDLELGEDGRFGYGSLALYWFEPDRHPFLLRVEGKLAGLALVTRNDEVWDMAEFFVVRGCRGRGVGTQAAHEIWRRFPGIWQVRVMQANVPARHFWVEAISKFAGQAAHPVPFEKAGVCWTLFSFDSKGSGIA
jgi:predicted acetyltransferase